MKKFPVIIAALAVPVGLAIPASGEGAPAGGLCEGRPVTIPGTSGDDRLVGTDQDDVIDARGGNDVIRPGAGADLVCAGGGNDVIIDSDGGTFLGEAGADIFHIKGGLSTSDGGTGGDRFIVYTRGGDAAITGGPGKDTLDARRLREPLRVDLRLGTSGIGYAYWFKGDAEILGVENVMGTPQRDHIRGNGSANVLNGMDGSDLIEGFGGDDLLIGGNGDDTLDGGNGDDTLKGGPGDDWLTGGPGVNTCQGGHPWWDACF